MAVRQHWGQMGLTVSLGHREATPRGAGPLVGVEHMEDRQWRNLPSECLVLSNL